MNEIFGSSIIINFNNFCIKVTLLFDLSERGYPGKAICAKLYTPFIIGWKIFKPLIYFKTKS